MGTSARPVETSGVDVDGRRRRSSRRRRPWWRRRATWRALLRAVLVVAFLILVFLLVYRQLASANTRSPTEGASGDGFGRAARIA